MEHGSFEILRLFGADPAERAVQKTERIGIGQLKTAVDFVAVHFTIEDELILRRPLKREIGLPFPAAGLCQNDRIAVGIDRGVIAGERVIPALEIDSIGRVEDRAAPASIVIVQDRWPCFPVDR